MIGELFKTRSRNNEKRNLMVFLRPKILVDDFSAAIETDAKYNYMRGEQLKSGRPKTEALPLIPFTPEPSLPPIPAPLPPRETAPGPVGPDGAPQGPESPTVPPPAPPPTTPPAQPPPQ